MQMLKLTRHAKIQQKKAALLADKGHVHRSGIQWMIPVLWIRAGIKKAALLADKGHVRRSGIQWMIPILWIRAMSTFVRSLTINCKRQIV
jgi:hypothetical protein